MHGRHLTADDRRIVSALGAQTVTALERRRLEDEAATAAVLAEADELRTALLRAVSHDLRTPLASIKASVTSLLQRDVEWSPEAEAEFLATIDEESDRLDHLVANLLDMSRLQTGALRVALRPVVLRGGRAVGAGEPERTDGRRRGRRRRDRRRRSQADPALLERAVANVIANAVSHSPPGARIRIEAGAIADRVDLRVVDHGPGIPTADRERVFEPFQRLGDGATGVGLGLAVARGFVDAMGGELTIDDTPGGGLTMVISLPGPAISCALDSAARATGDDAVTRVLVVDDEPQILRALSTNLKARGYDVDLAPTGEEALRLAADHHPDLVVLDLGLPGIDGIEVVRGLRGWTHGPHHRAVGA